MSAKGKRGGTNAPKWIVDAIAHHSATMDETHMGCDWIDAASRCWRCGNESRLQRCHIIPRSMGGPDVPHNFVALCARCHDEAPDVNSAEMMWAWIKATCSTLHGEMWARRTVDGMRKQDVKYLASMSIDEIECILRDAASRVGIHCGQGNQGAYIKTSSWVASMSLAIAEHRRKRVDTTR